ncbi:hypothetical protein DSM3645_03123 [Blastopirellula marina DSM 3645]|uniref:Uncharacterized protein n=1 Tax=Blastopirellula marina DSM 3645 TaxID=314230 RepID=A3ZVT8_9BACT|nr:hypothetical protein DSM3645_03123 [Blastopirellula marina DSM 3645]
MAEEVAHDALQCQVARHGLRHDLFRAIPRRYLEPF